MALCPEHPKRDQNPKFTPLKETTSIPVCFIWEFPTPGELSLLILVSSIVQITTTKLIHQLHHIALFCFTNLTHSVLLLQNYRNSRWERVHSWLKLAIASTSAKTWTDSKHPGNGSANLQCQDDLEMVQNATNSNNTVLEDGSRDADSVQIKTMATVATAIENIARILFPLAFIGYNIFYWTYY